MPVGVKLIEIVGHMSGRLLGCEPPNSKKPLNLIGCDWVRVDDGDGW